MYSPLELRAGVDLQRPCGARRPRRARAPGGRDGSGAAKGASAAAWLGWAPAAGREPRPGKPAAAGFHRWIPAKALGPFPVLVPAQAARKSFSLYGKCPPDARAGRVLHRSTHPAPPQSATSRHLLQVLLSAPFQAQRLHCAARARIHRCRGVPAGCPGCSIYGNSRGARESKHRERQAAPGVCRGARPARAISFRENPT